MLSPCAHFTNSPVSEKAAGKCKSRVRNLLSGSMNLTMEKSRVVGPMGWEARQLIEHSRAAQAEMSTGAERPPGERGAQSPRARRGRPQIAHDVPGHEQVSAEPLGRRR